MQGSFPAAAIAQKRHAGGVRALDGRFRRLADFRKGACPEIEAARRKTATLATSLLPSAQALTPIYSAAAAGVSPRELAALGGGHVDATKAPSVERWPIETIVVFGSRVRFL